MNTTIDMIGLEGQSSGNCASFLHSCLSSIFQNILEKFRFYSLKRKTSHLQGIRLGWKGNLVRIVQMTGI